MKQPVDLLARVAAIHASRRQKSASSPAELLTLVREADSGSQLTLPLWSEAVRGVPNIALRSALFGAIKKGARPYLERVEIHAQNGISILYTGARLDQGDLDVWETVLHVVRHQALGGECRITGYQFLKLLGKTDTGKNRDTLNRRLSRMKATALDVKVGNYSYEGSLIDDVFRDEDSRKFVIHLNPRLRALFEPGCYTQIDWLVRHHLDGKPLAQWLHGYFASHAEIYPIKIETLHRFCGSEAELRRFKQTLEDALGDLADTSNANGVPFRFEIRSNMVHVEHKPGRRIFRGERR